ncbi:MAG: two-component system response regulator OmpR [Sulfuricellaceae bacterium]|nr:two-component system response regulator OmpR [Sulfuricellaceae bacterium]
MKKDERYNILVIDDDLRLRDLLNSYLTEQGFSVRALADASGLDSFLASQRVDLIVLDLMLPGEDGLSVCRRLHNSEKSLPIIMLTAKGDEVDRIVGLEMGADDYLPKPFNPRELVARIHAVLRRRQPAAPPGSPVPGEEEIEFGRYMLNFTTRRLTTRSGESTSLTTGEFSLLKALVNHANQPLSRDQLLELARGRDRDAFDRSIDVQISRLRKLIEDDPAHPRYIQTVWGHGYVFVPEEKAP